MDEVDEEIIGRPPVFSCHCCGRQLGAEGLVRHVSIEITEPRPYGEALRVGSEQGLPCSGGEGWLCGDCSPTVARVVDDIYAICSRANRMSS